MANKPEFQKTVLIGLGGAGQETVLRTKRLLLDTYGVLPPCVKILCLDTDATPLKLPSATSPRDYSFDPQEFFHIKVSQPTDFIKNSPEVQRWYVKPTPVGAISNGAGAVRQNGRLAFFYHFNEISSRLNTIFDELAHQPLDKWMNNAQLELAANTDFELAHRDPQVFVCGSLAGGTGSGTFIDTGLLLRDLNPDILIHGYFQLAWPYRNKPFAHRTGPNTYAALAELDNLQSIMYGTKNFHPYKVRYSQQKEITVTQAPYDLVHLIDGRNEYGQNLGDLTSVCNAMADAIFLAMSAMSFPVASAVDNLRSAINTDNPKVWQGRYARYSSFGVSSIHYPSKEIHRLISAMNALDLCRTAIHRVESTDSTNLQHPVQDDVEKFITKLNLHRNHIQHSICPDTSEILLPIDNFEISESAFPSLIKARFDSEERNVTNQLEAQFKKDGQVFIDNLLNVVSDEIRKIKENPVYDSAYRREWSSRLLDHVKPIFNQVAEEIVQITTLIADLQIEVDSLLRIAQEASYYPMIGGPRNRATKRWAAQAESLLTAKKRLLNLNHEKEFYEKLIQRLEQEAAIAVPTTSETGAALKAAEKKLMDVVIREKKNLDLLARRPNHILLGDGFVALTDQHKSSTKWEEAFASYDEFIKTCSVHHTETYLTLNKESLQKLCDLFSDFCLQKHSRLAIIDVDQALDTFKRLSDKPENYLQKQFDRLIELSGAMWSFDRGRITPNQGLDVNKITDFGFCDHENGGSMYGKIIKEAKTLNHIIYEPSFSSTGDPSRIWLLSFAARMPAYFMNGLIEAKNTYLEQIVPTYHIDSDLEMNVPDLFPVDETDNITLRVLGMAIVPGIDIIKDEKLAKGHKFICDHKAINEKFYFGEPKSWFLFRAMYEDIKDNYNPKSDQNLLDELITLLKEKVQATDRAKLRTCIDDYLKQVHKKLDAKDFSRLSSARWTYREVTELERFLKTEAEGGYAMNIERYIKG
jgi:hypothetical protein